jgi:hypothetical protein
MVKLTIKPEFIKESRGYDIARNWPIVRLSVVGASTRTGKIHALSVDFIETQEGANIDAMRNLRRHMRELRIPLKGLVKWSS